MDDKAWERWSALGGLLYVVLILIASFIPGSPPKTGDSAQRIARFVTDKSGEIRWAAYLTGLAILALFWFAGGIWRLLRRAEGGEPRLAVVAILGIGFSTLTSALAAIMLGVLGILGVSGSGGLSGTKFTYVLSTNISVATAFGVAALVGACSAAIIRTGVLPKALGWIGAPTAVALVAAGGVVASSSDAFFYLSFTAFLVFSLWLVVLSIVMFRTANERAGSTA